MSENNRWRRLGRTVRVDGIAFAIPMVLIVCPLIGAFVGRYLANRWGIPALLPLGIAAGLAAGIWECIRLVKQLNQAPK